MVELHRISGITIRLYSLCIITVERVRFEYIKLFTHRFIYIMNKLSVRTTIRNNICPD
jgi:hypothetical protein